MSGDNDMLLEEQVDAIVPSAAFDDGSGDLKEPPASAVEEYYKNSRSSSERIELAWRDIELSVHVKDGKRSTMGSTVYQERKILNKCSGKTESGRMLAIMGPTGCGKTSLMNVLAARVAGKGSEALSLQGSITVNGEKRDDDTFRKLSSYVTQDDLMFAHLTVLETLTLAAHFYCPSTDSLEQKENLVNGILLALGLYKARNTIIGNQKYRGVSGGERKRVNIATQIITDPAALFLDEPTSGLDAFQALAVMECIKNLADHGRMVVAVVHQPRSSIFQLFDQLLLLSDGNDVYFGDAKDGLKYFADAGYPCKLRFNPADHFLDVLSRDSRSDEGLKQSTERLVRMRKFWLGYRNGEDKADGVTDKEKSAGGKGEGMRAIGVDEASSPSSLFNKALLLSWRSWREITGDWKVIVVSYSIFTLLSLVIGGIYSDLGDDQLSIQNRNGLLFFMGVNMGFNGLFSVLNSFPREKVVVGRERANRAYGFLPYFMSKFMVELPIKVFPAFIYSHVVYWIAGLNPDRFGEMVGLLVLQINTTILLGYAISATMPTIEAATAVGPLCMIINILFGGFYISIDSLPAVLEYIPYISFQRWFFQAAIINEYKGTTISCDGAGSACLATGEEVIESLAFDGHSIEYGIFGLGMCLLGYLLYTLVTMQLTVDTFISLGHRGSKYASIEEDGGVLRDNERGDGFVESQAAPRIEGALEDGLGEVGIEM